MTRFLCILSLLVLPSLYSISQENSKLSAEEKAYFFHIVRKSPILEKNIGRYIEYKGPQISFASGDLNYDSIESIIINNPSLLFIRSSEIAKSPKGLIAEAANKMALWELNKILLAKRFDNEEEITMYQGKLDNFETILLKKLPRSAIKEDNKGNEFPHKKIYNLLDPVLSLEEKTEMISSFYFLTKSDQLNTLDAINYAVNNYVENRTYYIYKALGGEADFFTNILVAAGDGSNTTGLLDEREKDEQGRWNKGLPKAVGLFPYQLEMLTGEKGENTIEPKRFTVNHLKTVGHNKITNLHFDVWGYNSKKQTTVVIEKNGISYHLFGSGSTRFLSPDSTFSDGATFQSVINELEFVKIKKLNDMISGKRGFDYWISHYEKKKAESAKDIKKLELEYSDFGHTSIVTKNKMSRKGKKAMKKARTERPNEQIDPKKSADIKPKTDSQKDKRSIIQEELIRENEKYKTYVGNIKNLKYEKENAQKILAEYQLKLNYYNSLMGTNWAKFTYKEGLYTFSDSTTFDMLTQEFQFPESEESDTFEVRLLAIPYSCLSKQADEVMLHIHMTDAEPSYDARLQIRLEDAFESDKYVLTRQLISKEDSVAVKQFFESMLNKKLPIYIKAKGNGVGMWNGNKTVKSPKVGELSSYPGSTPEARRDSRMDTSFVRLRKTELIIKTKNNITFEVNSFTDPVASNLEITNPAILAAMDKYGFTKNDILSAYRSAFILKKMRQELNILAGEYLDQQTAKIVLDRLNAEIDKAKIQVGKTSFKMKDLLP
jgi:hypothetical protein